MTPRPLISLHPEDNIAVAARGLPAGATCPLTTGGEIANWYYENHYNG